MSEQEAAERVLIARFAEPDRASGAVEALIEHDYPMDMISMLGRPAAVGDDPLGIYYRTSGERMRGWGKLGAFWGGIWGLLAGAAGLFVVPGLGFIAAAGPVVDALAGAAAGAAGGGGAMAGAGAVSHLATAMRSAGVPEQELDRLHTAIENGEYVLMLRCRRAECERYRPVLEEACVDEVYEHPFGNWRH
ncbi:hypothetical protein [Thiohalomonas denitrificans]|uniref:DUF1269 domain-containing protein n=1 Tax=Thiohalomonas denitrificans TaxID=415747 RepID=A0A1G5Q6U9_9GAMM|nr:hypothetical protein [Thiohalomonas denitrificans]SCZ57111.1 hypothetical protein SAMN03097708_01365 [Thiohalomonas denitrificans]